MAFSFEGLHEPLFAVLKDCDSAFRSGVVETGDGVRPFDAQYIAERLASRGNEYAAGTIARVLEHLSKDPNNHIVLLFKSLNNPDVIHIDSYVLEFIRKHEFEVIMGSPGFDAQYISDCLGLWRNPVACALRRLADDGRNYLGLTDRDTDNPKPIRDYGASRSSALAIAE